MIRKITLMFLVCLGVQYVTKAQPICGFDQAHQQMLNTNSSYAQSVNQFNQQVANWIANTSNPNALLAITTNGDTVYEVPLVVHVMHTGGAVGSAYNISDGKIDSTIDYVNKVFAAQWPSYPDSASGGTYFPFRFKLAKRSPNCTATSGIQRVNVSTTYSSYTAGGVKRSTSTGIDDTLVKNLSRWPNTEYYNIWVVNKIDGEDGYPPVSGPFVAGYAYFPGAPARDDGTIMLASQMKPGSITLPHELGHAFNLYHTFQSLTTGCAPNTNCLTQGDHVCDTEPHTDKDPSKCPSGTNNSCTGSTYGDATAKNIMNYCNCQDRFTKGQRTRFISALITMRSSLISSQGSVALPSTSLPSVCTPSHNNPNTKQDSGPRSVKIYDGTLTYMDVTSPGGYNLDGQQVYRDMTCAHRATLNVGNTYTIEFTSAFGDKGLAYIDWNNDGVLGNSTGERIAITDKSGGSLHDASFSVPITAKQCVPIRMRVISDNTSGTLDSCSNMNLGQTEDYEVLVIGGSANSGSVTISNPPKGGNPSCFGTQLTFKATPGIGTTAVGYQWYKNDTLLTGQTADSLVGGSLFGDKDTVHVELYYSTLCGIDTVKSNEVVIERKITIPAAVTIGVTNGTNPTCVDDTVTFSVVSNVNPGPNPVYQWMINGIEVSGATGTSFKVYNKIDSVISVKMVSSAGAPCVLIDTVYSNNIKVDDTTKRPVANIALTIGTNPGCAGQLLQFTATPTIGGKNPTYQWSVNGSNITGATNSTYSSSTLQNNDQVRVTMTSSSVCANPPTVTSDSIVVKHEKITADIVIAQTTGKNPACEGKPVIFSANTTNAGTNPNFQWIVNGQKMNGATTPIYVTDSLKNNDQVQCVLIATDSCVANPLDTSNAITMAITPSKRPSVTVAITAGKNPGCLDSLVEFTATVKDIGSNPAYDWIINGYPLAMGQVFSTSALLDGNTVMVRVHQTDGGCYLPDTVFSTPIVMVRSVTPEPPIISLIGNMMHTNFDSSFVWFGPNGQMPDGPEGKAYPDTIGAYYAVTNNNGCWSKPSNILRITLLDIMSMEISNLDVYPNPTSDVVVLNWKGETANCAIHVYNAIGQVVMNDEARGVQRKTLNLKHLSDGTYYILLKGDDGKVGVVKVTLAK